MKSHGLSRATVTHGINVNLGYKVNMCGVNEAENFDIIDKDYKFTTVNLVTCIFKE
jgi:hypothetical protein